MYFKYFLRSSKYLYNILNVCIILPYVDMWQFIEILSYCFAFRMSLHFVPSPPNLKRCLRRYLCSCLLVCMSDDFLSIHFCNCWIKGNACINFFYLNKLGDIWGIPFLICSEHAQCLRWPGGGWGFHRKQILAGPGWQLLVQNVEVPPSSCDGPGCFALPRQRQTTVGYL